MRLTRQSRRTEGVELDIAAMIDVVMLLLIFFMCTTSFTMPEKRIDTQVIGQGVSDDIAEFEPIEIHLVQSTDGIVVRCDGKSCKTFEELGQLLTLRRAIADVDVIVKGDPTVPFWYMTAAADTCYKSDLKRVGFSTEGALN
jgi:biopolymer transport protein ExbD